LIQGCEPENEIILLDLEADVFPFSHFEQPAATILQQKNLDWRGAMA
jgi:hypothetical protein